MKNLFQAMRGYVRDNGNELRDCCMPLVVVSKACLVATAPIVGVMAIFQKSEPAPKA